MEGGIFSRKKKYPRKEEKNPRPRKNKKMEDAICVWERLLESPFLERETRNEEREKKIDGDGKKKWVGWVGKMGAVPE